MACETHPGLRQHRDVAGAGIVQCVTDVRPKDGDIFPSQPADGQWVYTAFLTNGYAESYQEVNRPGREAYRSVPSSAEVKNEWSGVIRTSTFLTKLDVFRRCICIPLYRWLCGSVEDVQVCTP